VIRGESRGLPVPHSPRKQQTNGRTSCPRIPPGVSFSGKNRHFVESPNATQREIPAMNRLKLSTLVVKLM
jgi:hypothetical protein